MKYYSNHLNYGHLKSIQPWWLGVERLLHKKHVSVVVDKSPLGAWYRFVCPVSNGLITWLGGPFENHKFLTTKQTFSDAFQTTIWQPLTFGPFTYQTCPVFRWLLSYNSRLLRMHVCFYKDWMWDDENQIFIFKMNPTTLQCCNVQISLKTSLLVWRKYVCN